MLVSAAAALLTLALAPVQDPVKLHNGWRLEPAGVTTRSEGDMFLGATPSPDHALIAVVATGAQAHGLYVFDGLTGEQKQRIPLDRAWHGVTWSPDGSKLYVSGGVKPMVHRFERSADGEMRSLPAHDLALLPETKSDYAQVAPWLSGLAISPDGKTLYLAATQRDEVLALDAESGSLRGRIKLNSGSRPYAVRLSATGQDLYVGLWASSAVAQIKAPSMELTRQFRTGSHPNELLLADGRLFVTCGNDDAVVIHNPANGQIQEWVSTRITPAAPAGSTPVAMAMDETNKRLFVANADNNSVAVLDVSKPGRTRLNGFIPTAWYPSALALTKNGSTLVVASGKGFGTGPNGFSNGPIDPVAPRGYPYIVTLLKGTFSSVPVPDAAGLVQHTEKVLALSPYSDAILMRPKAAPRPGSNAIPSRVGDPSPIKHVLYIIKENRTYDQLFGAFRDHKGRLRGKGDPNLVLFGEDVTPNHHALAREFVQLDNLYCDGEVSVDGHHWSNGAYVPDFMARTWVQQYSGKGTPPLNPELAATPNGRIWDLCERAGVTFRTYYYHTRERMSQAWAQARAARRRDYDYIDIFIDEFQEFEKSKTMPQFMVMALSENHTSGTRPGAFTPKACVASNDLALGKLVEAISTSSYWSKFAIFVIEDDAQNGPDHVDAHRTVGLVISPYTKRNHLDSTFYTTCSMLRTMELILGLPPMSQYDAAATPMYASFSNRRNLAPYKCRPAQVDLQAINPPRGTGAERSLAMDFSEPDRLTEADEDALNRILWHSIKGDHVPYPGIRRAMHWSTRWTSCK